MKPLVIDTDSWLCRLAVRFGGLKTHNRWGDPYSIDSCEFNRAVGLAFMVVTAIGLAILGITGGYGFITYSAITNLYSNIVGTVFTGNTGASIVGYFINSVMIIAAIVIYTGPYILTGLYQVINILVQLVGNLVSLTSSKRKVRKEVKPSVVKELYQAAKDKYCVPVTFVKAEKEGE